MKIVLIVFISTLLSISGIYILREKIFKVNELAPDEDSEQTDGRKKNTLG